MLCLAALLLILDPAAEAGPVLWGSLRAAQKSSLSPTPSSSEDGRPASTASQGRTWVKRLRPTAWRAGAASRMQSSLGASWGRAQERRAGRAIARDFPEGR